jgi:hypothetical protein
MMMIMAIVIVQGDKPSKLASTNSNLDSGSVNGVGGGANDSDAGASTHDMTAGSGTGGKWGEGGGSGGGGGGGRAAMGGGSGGTGASTSMSTGTTGGIIIVNQATNVSDAAVPVSAMQMLQALPKVCTCVFVQCEHFNPNIDSINDCSSILSFGNPQTRLHSVCCPLSSLAPSLCVFVHVFYLNSSGMG